MKIMIEEQDQPIARKGFEIEGLAENPVTSGIKKETCHERQGNLIFNCELTSSSDFIIYDMETYCREKLKVSSENTIMPLTLNLVFEGEFDYCYKGCTPREGDRWKEGTLNLYSAADMSSYSIYRKDSFQRQFAICFSDDYFQKLATQLPEIFSTARERYDQGLPSQLFLKHRPCSPELLLLINQIRNLRAGDNTNGLLLEAKILEVMALIFETDRPSPQLSSSDREKMIEARNILLKNFRNPPSLFQLALSVGTNEFKLKQGFKELFHNTVYGVLSEFRMSQARQYLRDSNYSIQEISERIGFEHQGSFSKAFRKHTGASPIQFRMQTISG